MHWTSQQSSFPLKGLVFGSPSSKEVKHRRSLSSERSKRRDGDGTHGKTQKSTPGFKLKCRYCRLQFQVYLILLHRPSCRTLSGSFPVLLMCADVDFLLQPRSGMKVGMKKLRRSWNAVECREFQ